MKKYRMFVAVALLAAFLPLPAAAKILRYANQGELKSLDPYTLNETTTLAHLGNVYEGLTRRGKNLEMLPGLAERWEVMEPTRLRFYLRKGVTFHNGEPFTADDVLFSADRSRMNGSNLKTRIPREARFVRIDDHTVDVVLPSPNPVVHYQWDTWYIMSKRWAEANDAGQPSPASGTKPGHAALNANGTGPFRIISHEPGVRTVFRPHAGWWGKPEHNLTEVVFTPIADDTARVAALLSGTVDLIEPVPVQDINRVNMNPATHVLSGPELRTVFLGFDHARDVLLFSDVTGRNPFRDKRVRQAFYQAIDIEAIRTRVMRNQSIPAATLISPQIFAPAAEIKRTPFDPENARRLLAEAGYSNGFTVVLDCPDNRYINDAEICRAVATMLGRIGVRVQPGIQPKEQYFAQVLRIGGYRTSFYMHGWTPGTLDAHSVLHFLLGCRNNAASNRGEANLGGYCNPQIDALTAQVLLEPDAAARNGLIRKALEMAAADFAYIPLHQQALSWGAARKVKVTTRADNQMLLYWIRID